MKLLSKKEFAAAEGVSPSLVSKWVRVGMPTVGGKIDPAAARAWLKQNTERSGTETLTQARTRAASMLADLRRIELGKLAGELLPAAEVHEDAFKASRAVRDGMLAIPDRLASVIAAESDPVKIHTLLTGEIRKALEELADTLSQSEQ